jgi:hypothetical protein
MGEAAHPERKVDIPTTSVNKCPWCGGLDSIERGLCHMPGCGKRVNYTGPQPVDEKPLTVAEADKIARARAAKLGLVLEGDAQPPVDVKMLKALIKEWESKRPEESPSNLLKKRLDPDKDCPPDCKDKDPLCGKVSGCVIRTAWLEKQVSRVDNLSTEDF